MDKFPNATRKRCLFVRKRKTAFVATHACLCRMEQYYELCRASVKVCQIGRPKQFRPKRQLLLSSKRWLSLA